MRLRIDRSVVAVITILVLGSSAVLARPGTTTPAEDNMLITLKLSLTNGGAVEVTVAQGDTARVMVGRKALGLTPFVGKRNSSTVQVMVWELSEKKSSGHSATFLEEVRVRQGGKVFLSSKSIVETVELRGVSPVKRRQDW